MWRSADGRVTWAALDGVAASVLPDIPIHCLLVEPDRCDRLSLGTDLGVCVSTDGGASWAVENTGFAIVVIESLSLIRDGDGHPILLAFTHRRGAWRTQLAYSDETDRRPPRRRPPRAGSERAGHIGACMDRSRLRRARCPGLALLVDAVLAESPVQCPFIPEPGQRISRLAEAFEGVERAIEGNTSVARDEKDAGAGDPPSAGVQAHDIGNPRVSEAHVAPREDEATAERQRPDVKDQEHVILLEHPPSRRRPDHSLAENAGERCIV